MNKHLVLAWLFAAGLVFVIIFAYDSYIDDQKYSHNPVNISSYKIRKDYEIDPISILDALKQGKSNVFTPWQGDPSPIEELPNVNISWTQEDYLQIADSLSQFVWGESLDFKDWKVYSLHFRINCESLGFDYGEITYFKKDNMNGHRGYTTRHIEIDPYSGLVSLGDEEQYPRPILFKKWNYLALSAFEITADDALRMSDENGGRDARLKEGNKCYINLRAPASVTSDNDKWHISYISDHLFFEVFIDPYTGEFEFQQ